MMLDRWGCPHICSHLDSWINTALTKNVHSLSLFGPYKSCNLVLPLSVFTCGSLQSLKVTDMTLLFPNTLVDWLPKLESLRLDWVYLNDEANTNLQHLISRCPVLNNLFLVILHLDFTDHNFRISSSSLRCLHLHFLDRCSVKVNAASLECISLGGDICEISIEKSLTSLVEAHLDLTFYADDEEDVDEELDFPCDSIVEAIHAFNTAKVLTLTSYSYKGGIPVPFTLLEVPRCFSNSLKEVGLYHDECNEVDFEMIRFMLEHGSKLEHVTIACRDMLDSGSELEHGSELEDPEWYREMFQTILEFPRKSPVCEVHIFEWDFEHDGSRYFKVLTHRYDFNTNVWSSL